MLNTTRLRVLMAVADTGSVTAAAERLHYSQPSVSHHLHRLEAEVDAALVRRDGRGVALTDAGAALAERAREIVGLLEAAEHETAMYAGLRRGRVRMAAFPSALATIVPVVARQMAERHPGIELTLLEAEPPEALTAVRNGRVDVAMVFQHPDDVAGDHQRVRLRPLLQDELFLVTPGDLDVRDVAQCADRDWIAGCERCRAHLLRTCERAGFRPKIAYETDDYVAVQALVAAGLGVTTLPGLALQAHTHPAVRVRALPTNHRTVTVAVPVAAPLSAAAGTFVDLLAEAGAVDGPPAGSAYDGVGAHPVAGWRLPS